MTTYLLDTNACIAPINWHRGQRPSPIPTRGGPPERGPAVVDRTGGALVWGREEPAEGQQQAATRSLLRWPTRAGRFDEDDAQAAGTVRAELKPQEHRSWPTTSSWRRPGDAAVVSVTSNAKEFVRVAGLKWRTGQSLGASRHAVWIFSRARSIRRRRPRRRFALFRLAVPRPRRRLPSSLPESQDWEVGIRAGVSERMGSRHLRETAGQVRRVPTSPIPAGDRRRDSLAPLRRRRAPSAVRGGRLSAASRRVLQLPRRRLRRDELAGRRDGVAADVSTVRPRCRSRALSVGSGRARLDLLRAGDSCLACAAARFAPAD